MTNEALFYTVIFPFIAFFGAFAFAIYPNKDALHPTGERRATRLHWQHSYISSKAGSRSSASVLAYWQPR